MINSAQIANLLRPLLAAAYGSYEEYRSEWSEIFGQYTSDKAQEVEVEFKFLNLAQVRSEGAPTPFDTMGQRSVTTYTMREVSLGYQITRIALADNLYKDYFPLGTKALKQSFDQTKETFGASVLNLAFTATVIGGDGVSLANTAHPIDTGTQANTPAVQVDLSEAGLESAIIAISKFRDVAGKIIKVLPKKLIVPPENDFVADRLLASEFRVNTPNNDINAIVHGSRIPEGYRVNHFLTLPRSWYLLTNAANGLKFYERQPFETDVYSDPSTQNVLVMGSERYAFGWSNWRSLYASSGGA